MNRAGWTLPPILLLEICNIFQTDELGRMDPSPPWGYVKDQVFRPQDDSLVELRAWISIGFTSVAPQMLENDVKSSTVWAFCELKMPLTLWYIELGELFFRAKRILCISYTLFCVYTWNVVNKVWPLYVRMCVCVCVCEHFSVYIWTFMSSMYKCIYIALL
jgi:hypothetical protein